MLLMLWNNIKTNFQKNQYSLWEEILDVGTHKSLDNPLPVLMFTGTEEKKPEQRGAGLSPAFTELASSVASALSGRSP